MSSLPTLRRFFAWWGGELGQLFALRGPRARLVATDRGDAVELVRWSGSRQAERRTVDPAADPAQARRQVRTLGHKLPPVDLVLPAAAGLRTRLTLPAAVEANLAEVLGLEIDRETPFRREDVSWSHRVVARQGDSLAVEIAIVPRAVIGKARGRIEALGLPVATVGLEQWPIPLEAPSRRRPTRLTRALVLACLLAGLAALAVPPGRQHLELAALTEQQAALRQQALVAERLRAEWEARQGGGDLDALKRRHTGALGLIAGLTRLLPDDAWLTELRLTGQEVILAGYAPSAAELISAIERSGLMERARFLAPVIQDPLRKRERFQIGAELKAEAAR